MIIINYKSKKIVILCVLLTFFLFLSLIPNQTISAKAEETPETSGNILFVNKDYDFYLQDFYDDEDRYHQYTSVNFTKKYVETGIETEEVATITSNSQQYFGDTADITYILGSDDGTNNMDTDDNVYTRFNPGYFDYYYWIDMELESDSFTDINSEDIGVFEVISSHYSTSSVSFFYLYIYNFNTSSWDTISSTPQYSEYMENLTLTANWDKYFSATNTVKLRYYQKASSEKYLYIDILRITLGSKLNVEHTTSFSMVGQWMYRWAVYGSVYYTEWIPFEVMEPPSNFEAISESDYSTRWILQNSSVIAVEDFHDDINTTYWNLVDVSDSYFDYSTIATMDATVFAGYPNNNYGTETWFGVSYTEGGDRYNTHIAFGNINSNYLFLNESESYYIVAYAYSTYSPEYVECYNTSSFVENTITWNNAPAGINLLSTYNALGTGWHQILATGIYDYYLLKPNTTSHKNTIFYHSREYTNKPYFLREDVSKNYFGDGYMYMQTDTSETISLLSQTYGSTYNLSSGDYFEVDLQTNSDSQITLKLYKTGSLQKTLILSPSGNSNFNRRTVKISVSEALEFDQLKISSNFENKDYVKIHDIKTYKYTITGDYADFYVGSKRSKEIYLTPDNINPYDLRIYEVIGGSEILRINEYININSTGQAQRIFIPTETIQCRARITTIDELTTLTFEDYNIYLNRYLYGGYGRVFLYYDVFTTDLGEEVVFEVFDKLNNFIQNVSKTINTEYVNVPIEVYSLQIKNLMEQRTDIRINGSATYPLLSMDSIFFSLSKAHYTIYYQDTSGTDKQFSIYLNSNQAYELNKSKICFISYINQRGEYLPFQQFKTYLNGTLLYENIFYRFAGVDVNITITDLFGVEIKQEIYTVSNGDNYIPIILTQYSLKVMNQQENFNHINITRDPNYYVSPYSWSEWIAPGEIIKFTLFAGYYKINLTDTEHDTYTNYAYTLNGDDILLITSNNTLAQIIYNIANVNTTIGNQITAVEINLSYQNSAINNSIISITINMENLNTTLENMLIDIDTQILNVNNSISELYLFTSNSFINLGNEMNSSFIFIENNIWSINQSISTLVIGIDNQISLVNASIHTQFIEMNQQFIVTQSTLNFSFAFLNQTVVQIANDIEDNHVILYNLIEQRANDIDNNLIEINTLLNLLNNTVANESLVIQTLVNIIGNNMTDYYLYINNYLSLIDNNITNNNIQLVSILDLIGNNITTNHFIIQNLLDVIGNNITSNHIGILTNLNLINMTIDQNQIELINRLLLINSTINDLFFDLTNQIILVNDTIYTAILNLSTSVEFGVDVILGNLTLTYQQNEFLTELYKRTMFSQLLNWTGAAYNYSIMEDRIDVWDFINNYKNQSITVFLRYGSEIENMTISAQNTITQYLPRTGTEYRLYSVATGEYLDEWQPLPENRTIDFGFYEVDVPVDPTPIVNNMMIMFWVFIFFVIGYLNLVYWNNKFKKKQEPYNRYVLNKKKGKLTYDHREK